MIINLIIPYNKEIKDEVFIRIEHPMIIQLSHPDDSVSIFNESPRLIEEDVWWSMWSSDLEKSLSGGFIRSFRFSWSE